MHTEEHSLLLSHAPLGQHKGKEGRLTNKAAATQVELNGNHQFIPVKKVRCQIVKHEVKLDLNSSVPCDRPATAFVSLLVQWVVLYRSIKECFLDCLC